MMQDLWTHYIESLKRIQAAKGLFDKNINSAWICRKYSCPREESGSDGQDFAEWDLVLTTGWWTLGNDLTSSQLSVLLCKRTLVEAFPPGHWEEYLSAPAHRKSSLWVSYMIIKTEFQDSFIHQVFLCQAQFQGLGVQWWATLTWN